MHTFRIHQLNVQPLESIIKLVLDCLIIYVIFFLCMHFAHSQIDLLLFLFFLCYWLAEVIYFIEPPLFQPWPTCCPLFQFFSRNRVRVFSIIKPLSDSAVCEVSLTNIVHKRNQGCLLVFIEINIYESFDCPFSNIDILIKKCLSLLFCYYLAFSDTICVTPTDGEYAVAASISLQFQVFLLFDPIFKELPCLTFRHWSIYQSLTLQIKYF
ncbi:hypothetical protein FGO68_gene12690 [Halteria grandinella]|uniref:Uncharacterized protein n=1 Tax=Halteria grandinella TaxID=5974 RepID=A0A8J8T4P2_HALGN|nr:hypothetical protein FGO68_gene12690 [Halteria grandinella]